MEFFRKLDPRQQKILKITGGILIIIIILSALTGTIKQSFPLAYQGSTTNVAPSAMPIYDSSYGAGASKEMSLSTRNVIGSMPPQYNGGTTGSDAEAFAVTDYSATIETRDLKGTCDTVLALKTKDYVIFENSNTSEKFCNHTFKVKKDNVDEILADIKGLDPKQLVENTYTIKQQVADYTSQSDILKKKLSAIDDTLRSALLAYDEITAIATRANDAASLAKIIDSKIGIIERLTQQRIDVSTQLDYISRAKADELDRLDYTRFYVSVYENKYVDGTALRDSWKQAVRDFVTNANVIIQGITVGLVTFILIAAQWILYILILLFIAKYGWRFVRGFWTK